MISSHVTAANSTIAGHIHRAKRGYLRASEGAARGRDSERRMIQSGIAVHGHRKHQRLPKKNTRKMRPIHHTFHVSTGAMLRPGSWLPMRPATITATNASTTGIWNAG